VCVKGILHGNKIIVIVCSKMFQAMIAMFQAMISDVPSNVLSSPANGRDVKWSYG
jgi:hypothetical protein